MRPRHAIPLTPSKATRLSHPSCGAEHSFRTTNPLPAAHYCLKSFSCNTYGSSRKCCKQKTYGLTKPFRCSTYKKHGARGLSDSRTRQSSLATGLKSFFFKFLRALLRFFALSCNFEEVNSFPFMQFHTLSRKTGWWGSVLLTSLPSSLRSSANSASLRYLFPFSVVPLSMFPLPPHQVLNVVHLFSKQMELPPQALNLGFGAAIDRVIQFAPHAVFPVLPVLAHHDHRRLDRRQQRQNKIQQDKRIRIPCCPPHAHVDRRVDAAQDEKTNNKGPRPAELHHGIGDAVGQRRFFFDHIVRIAHRAHSHQLLRRVKLFPQHRQHIHSSVRLALQQRPDVASADFQALRIFHGRSVGLMRRLLQHRSETEELPMRRFIYHDFLSVFIHGRDPDLPADHHVRLPARVAHLVDALPRSEILQLYLPCQHRCLVFVEQRKQRNVFQHFGIAGHRPPLPRKLESRSVFCFKRLNRAQRASTVPIVNPMIGMASRCIRQTWKKLCGPKPGGLELFHHWITRTSTSCPAACCVNSADILCAQRSSPSAPPNEMITASTWFVAFVTIVRSESLVALPCGPTVSANSGSPSRFKSYLPMPLYVSPARPARKTISPTTCPRSYSPIGNRLSTDTRLITSTTALICGNPFPATTRRNSASAEPRYRAGSLPRALYALRVVSTWADSSTPRGNG